MRHRVWSRRVSSQWVPGTTREILVWFCWVALHPWHHRRNYTLYECLSPSVYYKNHRAPTSPRRSENRPEQSVKRSAGKPVMTTSGSIWLSVGREMAQRETETTVGNWKALQDYCRWVFVFHSWFSLLFFFFSQATERKNVWRGCQCSVVIQQLEMKVCRSNKGEIWPTDTLAKVELNGYKVSSSSYFYVHFQLLPNSCCRVSNVCMRSLICMIIREMHCS